MEARVAVKVYLTEQMAFMTVGSNSSVIFFILLSISCDNDLISSMSI